VAPIFAAACAVFFPTNGRCWSTGYMTDPLSLGAGAAGKIGSAVAASYARGRDERRQAYRRFQEAVVVYVMQIRDSRISPEAMGLAPDQRKHYVDALMQATTELAKALYEVRLVGNPGPRAAAEALREAIAGSFDAAAGRREELTQGEVARYTRAMESFTEACRHDLWYQPRWWQIWRVSWWQARRHRDTSTAPSLPARVPGDQPGAVQAGPVGPDVVLGGPTNAAIGMVRTVMGRSFQDDDARSFQNHDPHGVVFGAADQANAPEIPEAAVAESPAITPTRAADSSGEGDDVS
jgi:hypothetical protein